MSWHEAALLEELSAGPVMYKHSPRQIALFQINGQVFAIDNRCPHEGYPLVQGNVDENCVLTCNWHNWKFRLADGECILGGDDVRSYPVKVEAGKVLVNLADPPAEQLEAKILKGLKIAFDERDFERICREITRLRYYELDPIVAVKKAIEWSHDRLEFGMTHAYAALAEWLILTNEYEGDWERQLVCLSETVDHMAFDALRHKLYPLAETKSPFDAGEFCAAVEEERRDAAEAMVLGGLADGLHWLDMEAAFARAALAHYNDFGHSLIYV